MVVKFETYKTESREFRFRLKAPKDEIIVTSEGYESKQGCKAGITNIFYV